MKKKIIITAAVGALLVAGIFFLSGGAKVTGTELLLKLCNAFSAGGVLVACVGLLVFVSNHGAFDMISYGTVYVVGLMAREPDKKKYRDFYDYSQKKHENRIGFSHLLIVGGAYTAVGIILNVIYDMMIRG